MKTVKQLLGFAGLWFLVLWMVVSARPAASAAGSASAAASEVSEASAASESWYVMLIAERPVGSMQVERRPVGEGSVENLEAVIVLNRMGSVVRLSSSTSLGQDAAGLLQSVDHELLISSQATRFRAVVEPGRVRVRDEAGGNSFERELEYEGELLGPLGVERLWVESFSGVGDRISYKTFRPELAAIANVTLEVVGKETMMVQGDSMELWRVTETLKESPLVTTLWADSQGRLMRTAAQGPFGLMEAVLSDATAAALATSGGELPAELFRGTLVPTQVRLREPRSARRVVLELRHRNPEVGWPDLESAHQRVSERSPERLVLEVGRPILEARFEFPRPISSEADAGDLREYLTPNAYLQSDDPEARALAMKIVGETHDMLEAGLALERWVAENVRFDMGVVLAPSSEVLENRRGTCTEYAILLTTLARSLEIPARVVMGYVYAGGIYGGHAWTEILLGDEWIPLDGAIPSRGPADAARFAFQWDSLEDGIGALNAGAGLQLFGQIELSVLEYETDSVDQVFEPDQVGFLVEGNRYLNPSLGLAWLTPEGYAFGDLEMTWPETALVRLDGPEGRRATLSVRDRAYWLGDSGAIERALERAVPEAPLSELSVSGHPARRAADHGRAATAWVRGSEVWILEVLGEDAAESLGELLSGFELEP